jgi:transglutaminase-like putative cysteine protease
LYRRPEPLKRSLDAMSTILEVRHRTTYSYASPVNFGEHRLMFRPLAGHDLRVIDWDLTTNVPWRSHWIQDTFSNSVAVVTFQEPAAELTFVCRFSVEHYGVRDHELPLESKAEKLPLELTPDEWIDLQGFLRPHSRDAIGSVAAWAREMLRAGNHETRPVLRHMRDYMREQFAYQARDGRGCPPLLLLSGNRSGRFQLRYGEGRCWNGGLQFRLLGLFRFAIASLLSFRHFVLLKR